MVDHAQTRRFPRDIAEFPPLHLMTPEEIRKVVVANVISDVAELEGTEDRELAGPHGPLAIRNYRPKADRPLRSDVREAGGRHGTSE